MADNSIKLYYYEGRNTPIVAKSAKEASNKKRRGGKLKSVKKPSESDSKDISKGRWVRTRPNGKRVNGLAPGGKRGLGPKPKNYKRNDFYVFDS